MPDPRIHTVRAALFAVLLAAGLAAEAEGHGGAYRGPAPGLPPGVGGPTGGPTINPGPGGGPVTGGGSGGLLVPKKVAPDYTDWKTWWEFNKEPHLNLRARLGTKYSVTGVDPNADPVRPSYDELAQTVLDSLKRAVGSDDADIADSAVLALARITPREQGDAALEVLLEALGHRERTVKQSAILSLGVLGDRRATEPLLEILRDDGAGRKRLRQSSECDDTQRGMAAVALGFLSDPAAIPVLTRTYQRSDDGNLNLKGSILLALGLFDEGRYEIIPFLLEELGDRRTNVMIRAHVPIALARLGADGRVAVPELLKLVVSRKASDADRQSAAIALGELAGPEDREVVEALLKIAEKGDDAAARNFSFLALGQIGGRAAAASAAYEELLSGLERFLMHQLARPKRQAAVPFTALALALLARGSEPDSALRRRAVEQLEKAYDDTGNPEQRGAFAVALGLVEHPAAGEVLLSAFEEESNREVKGYLAEALGLVRHAPATKLLLEELAEDRDPQYRVQLAVGLGLMGDVEVSEQLVKDLGAARTLFETSSIGRALGRVGDRHALKPLVLLLEDRDRPGLARAFGAVAIGLIGEKTALPWNTRLSVGANYVAPFHVQTEILDIL